mgnify:CR=1 FL=1
MQFLAVYTVLLMAASIFEVGGQAFGSASNNTVTVSGTNSLSLQACLIEGKSFEKCLQEIQTKNEVLPNNAFSVKSGTMLLVQYYVVKNLMNVWTSFS